MKTGHLKARVQGQFYMQIIQGAEMKFIHPETGVEYNAGFIAFSVYSDRHEDGLARGQFSRLICYHKNYEIAKAEFEDEVEKYKTIAEENNTMRVVMIYNTSAAFLARRASSPRIQELLDRSRRLDSVGAKW